jgi:hypothetical protein
MGGEGETLVAMAAAPVDSGCWPCVARDVKWIPCGWIGGRFGGGGLDGGEAGVAAVGGGSRERLRREEERRGWREEKMDATGEGGEARDLGGAGGNRRCRGWGVRRGGRRGVAGGGAGGADSQRGRIMEGRHIYVPVFFLRFVLFRSRDLIWLVLIIVVLWKNVRCCRFPFRKANVKNVLHYCPLVWYVNFWITSFV